MVVRCQQGKHFKFTGQSQLMSDWLNSKYGIRSNSAKQAPIAAVLLLMMTVSERHSRAATQMTSHSRYRKIFVKTIFTSQSMHPVYTRQRAE